MNWQDLSMRQRAAVFQYALSKNIPIPDIKRQFEKGGLVQPAKPIETPKIELLKPYNTASGTKTGLYWIPDNTKPQVLSHIQDAEQLLAELANHPYHGFDMETQGYKMPTFGR